jgi:hypothetical protein
MGKVLLKQHVYHLQEIEFLILVEIHLGMYICWIVQKQE